MAAGVLGGESRLSTSVFLRFAIRKVRLQNTQVCRNTFVVLRRATLVKRSPRLDDHIRCNAQSVPNWREQKFLKIGALAGADAPKSRIQRSWCTYVMQWLCRRALVNCKSQIRPAISVHRMGCSPIAPRFQGDQLNVE